jgi:hypothetical protein
VAVTPPGEDVAVYDKIVAPPSEPGAVKATVAVVDPVAVAVPIVGAPGTVRGVAAVLAVAVPSPIALTALICMLYEVPLTSAVDPSVLNVEITSGEAVVPDARVLNDTPPSVEYS